ncbi:LDLR chaperone boca [Uranotaenia lowii]|uniref:LDLR chaperone boca n=1 Tax=Uranotaenia lowii TaxID=190385 RepID=UPI00247A8E0B|nr:LDLR chaperone boca [Uranotaenia lowii]
MNKLLIIIVIVVGACFLAEAKKFKGDDKPAWAKKDIRDYSDADMERLLDQWEEDEDPLEPDELPEHLRPAEPLDMSQLDMSNPESILKASKKGKTLMSFVTVNGSPSRTETEEITKLWQTSLWNNHIQAERYLIDDNRAIFMFKEGSQAWEAKDFLVEQERCLQVTIENKDYKGKHNADGDDSNKDEL